MRKLIKKRAMPLILLTIASVIVIFCAGCNNSTPTQATNNKTGIANENEVEKIRAFVDSKCKEYFTNDFINDTTNTLSTKGFGNTYITFYLNSKAGKVSFYNTYKIYSPTVENETITYELEPDKILLAPTTYVYIQMKMENGKWKINKTLH